MSVSRTAIEHALDEIASDEGGMRFQGLAVVLAKLRWPELVACERKKDLGLDAYASASVSPRHGGMGLSCSITAELSKIKKDAERAKPHFPDLQVLVFATSGKVTNETAEKWKEEIKKDYGWELIVMPREDIVITLQVPTNIGLCSTHLGIAVPTPEPTVEALLEAALAATNEVIANWSRRMDGKPMIDLRLVRLDDKGAETQETQQWAELNSLLFRSHRIVIEAPAGRGKTTTLIQLAREHRAAGRIACLIDLPAWVRRNIGIFDFLAGMPEFQSHRLAAGDLALINQTTQFTFLINGWNEMVPSESTDAAGLIRNLERSFATAGIAVATRAHPVTPPLPGSSRFRIQRIRRRERDAYIYGRLGVRAEQLSALLNADPVLDDLTTTPMILAEVVSLFEAGKPIPASKLGVLDAVIHLMESSEEHQAALADDPLFGGGRSYLEELGSWLVANGGVQIAEPQARTVISAVVHDLHNSGQIGITADPGAVLIALCSHHVLDRSSYPDISYTFFHQQFQELFAALRLTRELAAIAMTGAGRAEFAAKYINEPAWSQPISMLAEFIGRHTNDEPLPNAVAMGQALVEMTLPVDAVFASELSRLCGAEVWAAIREPMGARLRRLYGTPNDLSRDIGLAGMVATGSEDFKDILVPLLSAENGNSHLEVYRAWEPFEISSLGKDWGRMVRQWNEQARVHLVVEITHHNPAHADVVAFALADPSEAVRKALLSNIWWAMSPDEVLRFSATLDDIQFSELIAGLPAEHVPPSLRPRAAIAYAGMAGKSTDAASRLFAWRKAERMGDVQAIEGMKEALADMSAEQIRKLEPRRLLSSLEMLRKVDPPWATDWVITNLLSGGLQPDGWLHMVTGISVTLRDELVNRVMTENLVERRVPGVIPLLGAFADEEVVRRLFRRLCELRPTVAESRAGDDKQAERNLSRQVEDILREMAPEVVVGGILHELAVGSGAVEAEMIGEIFHIAGRHALPLREALPAALREQFRSYLKTAIATVLAHDDPHGQVKAHFATVLAQVGDASDLPEMERLIRADLVRMKAERAARVAAVTRVRKEAQP